MACTNAIDNMESTEMNLDALCDLLEEEDENEKDTKDKIEEHNARIAKSSPITDPTATTSNISNPSTSTKVVKQR